MSKKIYTLLGALVLMLMINTSIALESSSVTILYGACGMQDTTIIQVETPQGSVFSHNNFQNDTVFLRFERRGDEWLLNQDYSDSRLYVRQAVWLVEDNVLSEFQRGECLEVYVRFLFVGEQE